MPASRTTRMIPNRISWRAERNSSKSEVTNQHSTSTSSEDAPKPTKLATTVSGHTFGCARSSASMPESTCRSCGSLVPYASPSVVAKRIRSRAAKSSMRRSASLPFGIVTSVRSGVRICVERIPIRSTLPVTSSTLHQVADAERLVGGERDRAEQVLDRLLGAEGDRDAADAEAGEHRRDRVAERGERATPAPPRRRTRVPRLRVTDEQRARRRVAERPGPLHQELAPDVDRAPQHPEHAERRQRRRAASAANACAPGRSPSQGRSSAAAATVHSSVSAGAICTSSALVPARGRAPERAGAARAWSWPPTTRPRGERERGERRQREPLPPHDAPRPGALQALRHRVADPAVGQRVVPAVDASRRSGARRPSAARARRASRTRNTWSWPPFPSGTCPRTSTPSGMPSWRLPSGAGESASRRSVEVALEHGLAAAARARARAAPRRRGSTR